MVSRPSVALLFQSGSRKVAKTKVFATQEAAALIISVWPMPRNAEDDRVNQGIFQRAGTFLRQAAFSTAGDSHATGRVGSSALLVKARLGLQRVGVVQL